MSLEKIETKLIENWDVYYNLIKKLDDKDMIENFNKFLDEQEHRIVTCPASTKVGNIGAFTGGLVIHSLNVLKIMKELNKIHGSQCSTDDMIITSLFHDIGKIGSETEDYYLPQKSDWHRDKGINFEINPKLTNMPVVARSIWWFNHYNIKVSDNVLEALFSLYSSTKNNSVHEIYNVSNLSLLLQNSVRSACVLYKGKTSVLEM